jgi:putative CocE/NonD family hydrolase
MPRRRTRLALALLALAAAALVVPRGVAQASDPQVARDLRVAMSDGVALEVKLGGRGPLVGNELPARPVIVEFSPYAPACCAELGGPNFNYLQVHIRGTGLSNGSFDALGARTQQDVVDTLTWACTQPWSNGRLGLYGFSASAITVYNSLHLDLPCVQTAVLGSGTHELYRDLLYPGGVPNGMPAAGVLGLIGAPTVANLPERLFEEPLSAIDTAAGLATLPVDYQVHPTLDSYWRERGFRGDVNDLPILMLDGFFDVESRGAFQTFQELRGDGAHLLVVGAHDGVPTGSGGADRQRVAWYDHYLRDIDNGINRERVVQMFLAHGDREDMLAGDYVTGAGDNWPLPGTTWSTLHLDATSSGTATSINDGTLALAPPASATQSYPAVGSLPTASDPYNTAILGVFNNSPTLTDMAIAEPFGLSYTTAPLTTPLDAVGPASLDVVLASTAPETDIYAVLSDVWPNGSAHPMAAGRLRTSYPEVDLARSLVDNGRIVQPYGRYDLPEPAAVGEERRYHVELWPIGNRFEAGHRLRLHLLGASGASQPTTPGINTIRLGADGSRLYFPAAPGNDLAAALGARSSRTPAGAPAGGTTGRGVLAATGLDRSPALGAVLLALAIALRAVAVRRAAS